VSNDDTLREDHTVGLHFLEVSQVVVPRALPWEVLLQAWQPCLGEHERLHESEVRSVSAHVIISLSLSCRVECIVSCVQHNQGQHQLTAKLLHGYSVPMLNTFSHCKVTCFKPPACILAHQVESCRRMHLWSAGGGLKGHTQTVPCRSPGHVRWDRECAGMSYCCLHYSLKME
jgi:hypothetical protein